MLTAVDERKLKQAEYYQKNKEKFRLAAAAWKENNKDKIRLKERKLLIKKRYGLSWDAFENLYATANGRCEICGTFLKMLSEKHEQNVAACIDHCHITGKVRGILCRSCNVGIGHLKESKDRLFNAYKYLERFECLPQT